MPVCERARRRLPDRWALLALLLEASSCSSAKPSAARDPKPPVDGGVEAERPSLRLLKVVAWPGGGLQLTASRVADALAPDSLQIRREDGSSLAIQIAPDAEPSGITALVIAPAADEAEHRARLEAARALIEGLPQDERIGLWLGTGALPLLCELTERREHVLARLDAIAPEPAEDLAPGALVRLSERLMRVSAPVGPSARTLVALGVPPLAAADVPVLTPGKIALALAVLDGRAHDSDRDAWLVERWSRKRSPSDAGASLAQDLATLRANTLRLASCDGLAQSEALALEAGEARVGFEAPVGSPELSELACDAEAASRDDYPIGDAVTFELTPEQLTLHDQYDAAEDETEFTLNVRLDGAAAVPARAHFRGQTSLNCGRKSYSVHFSDDSPRRLGQQGFGSEFYLLSLCKDPGGFRQVLANRVMAQLGLMPLAQRYVRLRVADRERGVYLLLEKPDEYLKRNRAELSAVIRRRFDATGEPVEVKYPKPEREPDAANAVLAQYQAIVEPIATEDPEALPGVLSERVDLENYLRWLGLQSFFQCGDYVDETFFYASEEHGSPYFRNLGWDTDDLFEACHHNGKYAYKDAHELMYCAEGALDRALVVSPAVYQHYAETLARLMANELDPNRVAAELDHVRADLLGHLVEDPICIGTGEYLDGQPATCDRLRPWIEGLIDELAANMRARAELLRQRLSDYGVQP